MKTIEFDGIVQLEMPELEDFERIYDAIKETMQREDAIEIMDIIYERSKKMAETEGLDADAAFQGWNMIDKITWYVSEAYCLGFLRGTEAAFQTIAEQFQGDSASPRQEEN